MRTVLEQFFRLMLSQILYNFYLPVRIVAMVTILTRKSQSISRRTKKDCYTFASCLL